MNLPTSLQGVDEEVSHSLLRRGREGDMCGTSWRATIIVSQCRMKARELGRALTYLLTLAFVLLSKSPLVAHVPGQSQYNRHDDQ